MCLLNSFALISGHDHDETADSLVSASDSTSVCYDCIGSVGLNPADFVANADTGLSG